MVCPRRRSVEKTSCIYSDMNLKWFVFQRFHEWWRKKGVVTDDEDDEPDGRDIVSLRCRIVFLPSVATASLFFYDDVAPYSHQRSIRLK